MSTNIINSDNIKLNNKKVCCFCRFFIYVCHSNRCLREIVKKFLRCLPPVFSSPIPCLHEMWGNTGCNLVEATYKNYIFSQTQICLIHRTRKWKPNSQHTFIWSNWNPPTNISFYKHIWREHKQTEIKRISDGVYIITWCNWLWNVNIIHKHLLLMNIWHKLLFEI